MLRPSDDNHRGSAPLRREEENAHPLQTGDERFCVSGQPAGIADHLTGGVLVDQRGGLMGIPTVDASGPNGGDAMRALGYLTWSVSAS